jgi:hypothetical protein
MQLMPNPNALGIAGILSNALDTPSVLVSDGADDTTFQFLMRDGARFTVRVTLATYTPEED